MQEEWTYATIKNRENRVNIVMQREGNVRGQETRDPGPEFVTRVSRDASKMCAMDCGHAICRCS